MNIYDELSGIITEDRILINEPMSNHTSFKIGGKALYLVMPENTDQIIKLINYVKSKGISYLIVGNGSNLLISDKGFDGIVINTSKGYNKVSVKEEIIEAESGAPLSKIAAECLKNAFSGFEELSGIPGTIGGAIYMNAGAYNREIKDILIDATFIDENGDIKTLNNEELDFSYRHSYFSDKNLFILKARLKLSKGDSAQIKSKTLGYALRRREKQPLEFPSAGSTFKRPKTGYAAKLIEECGFKGFSVGGAMVSEKHSGFVINKGNATCKDVIELTNIIKNKVKEKFNVELELEVRLIGE